jgi:nucleoside-diphosphate-sugar epimerase
MENEKMKIMIFGGTGYIGNFLAKASLLLGHPTFVYARPITPRTTPSKVELHKELQSMGATFVLVHLLSLSLSLSLYIYIYIHIKKIHFTL